MRFLPGLTTVVKETNHLTLLCASYVAGNFGENTPHYIISLCVVGTAGNEVEQLWTGLYDYSWCRKVKATLGTYNCKVIVLAQCYTVVENACFGHSWWGRRCGVSQGP